MNNNTIKQMQPDYRPDEKFLTYGPESLTGAELLAIILRTGSQGQTSIDLTSKILYNESNSCEDLLNICRLNYEDLVRMKGIGRVKALQIKAIAELSKRIAMSRTPVSLIFRDPKTIADHYMEPLRYRRKEVVVLLLLNSACSLIKEIYISEGTVNASLFSPREIFIDALKYEAVSIILLHNHPSGSPRPSKADLEATKRVISAGMMIGITLIDHIIIGDNQYFSFKEEGLFNE